MACVAITQWKRGVKIVSLMMLIKSRCNMSLHDSKEAIDKFLDGHEQKFKFYKITDAQQFISDAEILGVIAHLCE